VQEFIFYSTFKLADNTHDYYKYSKQRTHDSPKLNKK